MLSYKKQAKKFILEEVGSDFAIVEKSIRDLTAFFCFTYQTRAFIHSGKAEDMCIGQGYHFIFKADNRLFSFGSGYSFSEALRHLQNQLDDEKTIRSIFYEFDIRNAYTLTINKLHKKQFVLDTLMQFYITYIIPEIVGKSIYRIPKSYTKKLLHERFSQLPVEFNGISKQDLPRLLTSLIRLECCQFDLGEKKEEKFASYTSKAKDKDLQPLW